MRPREFIVIGVALFIDGLQALLDLAFFVMGSTLGTTASTVGTAGGVGAGCVAGAAGGAAVGAVAAGVGAVPGAAAGCAIGAATGAVGGSVAGTAAASALTGLGIALGFAADVCVSLTFGVGLILLLIYFDMYQPLCVFGGSIFELIPGLDVLPGWTTMAVVSVIRARAEEKALEGGVGGVMARAALAGNAPREIIRVARAQNDSRARRETAREEAPQVAVNENSSARTHVELKNVDGIRPPANDNQPRTAYAS